MYTFYNADGNKETKQKTKIRIMSVEHIKNCFAYQKYVICIVLSQTFRRFIFLCVFFLSFFYCNNYYYVFPSHFSHSLNELNEFEMHFSSDCMSYVVCSDIDTIDCFWWKMNVSWACQMSVSLQFCWFMLNYRRFK